VDLRIFLEAVSRTYNRAEGVSSPAGQLLRRADEELAGHVPVGLLIEGSAGRGNAAVCPWVAVFDPDETSTATKGMYVVYLWAEDLRTVALSLNQGVTDLLQHHGAREARQILANQAIMIRKAVNERWRSALDAEISLGPRLGVLPRAYEAGNILARTYQTQELPSEPQLRADLGSFIELYQEALDARERLRATVPDAIATVRETAPRPTAEPLLHFKPKSDSDYVQHLVGRKLVKTRKHERLVDQYGRHLRKGGFAVGTNVHPRDLVARKDGQEWMIEAKIVRRGNSTFAVREALGQLVIYSYQLYSEDQQPHHVALFDESIGDLYPQILEKHGISSVWWTASGWQGSPTAVRQGLLG
jgi:hypothetical protein